MALFCHQVANSSVVLLDADTGLNERKKLDKVGFPKENIHIINEFSIPKKAIDIEDLFEPNFYHERFLEAYRMIIGYPGLDELPESWEEVKKHVDKAREENPRSSTSIGHSKYYSLYFEDHKENIGGFNKVLVADQIVNFLMESDYSDILKHTDTISKLLTELWNKHIKWKK